MHAAELVALGFWLAAGLLVVVAAVVGPEGQCDIENHDAWAAQSNRAGLALLAAALALGGAAVALAAGTFGRGTRRRRITRGALALLSAAAACGVGVIALLALVAFGCLE